jgi:hypothetical protein
VLCLKPAVPPTGKDEVSPSEDVSGQHHEDDDLEQEDEFFEGLEVSSSEEGGDGRRGGNGLFWNLGPLAEEGFGVPASVVGRGEAVTDDTRLLLCHWLGSALDLARVEARLNTDGECVRDPLGDASGLSDSNITKDDISDIGGETEEPLRNGRNTRIFVVEASHKGHGIASKICLVVEGVLRVDEALTDVEVLFNKSSTVFENETDLEDSSAQHVEEFRGTRMIVGRGQTTWSHFSNG